VRITTQYFPQIYTSGIKKHLAGLDYLILLRDYNGSKTDKVMSKKQLFTIEFPVRCSPGILYEFLSTPAGLQ